MARILRAAGVTAVVMLVLDLLWLGVAAAPIYKNALGDLMRPQAYWPAALLFYAMYIAAVNKYAVLGATSVRNAAWRGLEMGFFGYATYELTNWAVIRDWPASIVPIDLAWGCALTALVAAAGRWAAGDEK